MPDNLREFIDSQCGRDRDFSTPSEYIRTLIRRDKEHQAQQELEALLLKGLRSGPAQPLTEQDWAAIRKTAHQRLAEKHKQ